MPPPCRSFGRRFVSPGEKGRDGIEEDAMAMDPSHDHVPPLDPGHSEPGQRAIRSVRPLRHPNRPAPLGWPRPGAGDRSPWRWAGLPKEGVELGVLVSAQRDVAEQRLLVPADQQSEASLLLGVQHHRTAADVEEATSKSPTADATLAVSPVISVQRLLKAC